MTALLRVEHVSKRFGAIVAANDISAAIDRGSVVSLIGTNGAGKTTFVNMVTGYLRPDGGRVFLDGLDVTARAPREITGLGVGRSFQIPQLFSGLTALQNVVASITIGQDRGWRQLCRAARRDVVEWATELLRSFRLLAYQGRLPGALPGGVRKLLDVAMALATRPKLLILDEPTSGVGADEKFPLMDTIIEATRAGDLSIIFVEHDMDLVARYSQRALAFYNGEIIADGRPADVLMDPKVALYVLAKSGRSGAAPCSR